MPINILRYCHSVNRALLNDHKKLPIPTLDHRKDRKPRWSKLFKYAARQPLACTKYLLLIETLLHVNRPPCHLRHVLIYPPNDQRMIPLSHRQRIHAPSRSGEDLQRPNLRELEHREVNPLPHLDPPQPLRQVFLNGAPRQGSGIKAEVVQLCQVIRTVLRPDCEHTTRSNKVGQSENEKRRRETISTRFSEPVKCLFISAEGKSDKECILAEAVEH